MIDREFTVNAAGVGYNECGFQDSSTLRRSGSLEELVQQAFMNRIGGDSFNPQPSGEDKRQIVLA